MRVTTQQEFDAALASGEQLIDIVSEAGVWIDVVRTGSATVRAYGSATVRASGSATVRAYDSATVTAYDSATVTASGSATVTAYDSATVTAYGSATVTAYDSATVRAYGSATVTASGSATVRASDSATVRAYGSATVRAYDSATVTASDSATVTAYDSATVTAYGSATVTASDSATVRAGTHVAVHLHSKRATVEGGVVIDITDLDLDNPATWAAYKGLDVTDGKAIVYKAVDAALNAGHRWTLTAYPIGGTVEAPDWQSDDKCGHGLHFSPHPHLAHGYYTGEPGQERYLACEIDLTETVILDDKVKARACRVVHEVDIHGRQVQS
jgi:hypothetical protein